MGAPAMMLPTFEELDEVAKLVAGVDVRYDDLGPEAKIQILTLTLKAKELGLLDDIDTRLDVIAQWFKHSKLYER
jgi:hypothetical protein